MSSPPARRLIRLIRLIRLAAAAVVAFLVLPPTAVLAQRDAEPRSDQDGAAGGIAYDVALIGPEEDELRAVLEETSSLFTLREEPPPSALGLDRRASQDRDRLQAALRSAGYYDGTVDIRIDAGAQPAQVVIDVRPGPAYSIGAVTVRAPDGASLPFPGGPVDPAALGLGPGERARAARVVQAEADLVGRLRKAGHGFARVAERRVLVDHDRRTMEITYTLDPGPLVRFGATRIDGIEDVDETLVRGRLAWRDGQVFDPDLLDTARQDIAALGTFTIVRVALAPEPGPDGVTPVVVTVAERLPRFVGFGVSYSSFDGFGARAFWGHRNLFGGAEEFQITAQVARLNASTAGSGDVDDTDLTLGVDFRKPDFLSRKQTLLLRFAAIADNPPAYERTGVVLSGGLERPINDRLTVSYGVRNETSSIKTNERTYDTSFVGVPLEARYDASNSLLNPTEGFRVGLTVTPWVGVGGDVHDQFLSTTLSGSAYRALTEGDGVVLAGRAQIGGIIGATLSSIPPDKRFYAGGGGSVRGYGFQKVGPRDGYDDPTGGRSLFEAGIELRIKVTEAIGLVPFIDAGAVYDSAYPDFTSPLRFGAGIGLRYYTDFGPLRVDVGVPLNKQGDDESWQLYLSLGQAF